MSTVFSLVDVFYLTPMVHKTVVSVSMVTTPLPSYVFDVLTKVPNSN